MKLSFIPDYQDSPCGNHTVWKNKETIYTNPAYLHGTLEDQAGFDIVFRLRGETGTIELDGDHGEMEVDIHMNKGEYKVVPGILVWWIAGGQFGFKGLIVSPEDKESYSYAKNHQAKFSKII